MSFFIWRRGSENSDSMDRQRSPSRVISDPSKLSVISKGHQASPYGDLRRSQWKDDLDESQHVVRWDNDELIDEIDKTTDEKEEQCKIVIIPDGTNPIRSLTMAIERNRQYIDYIHFRGAQIYGFSSPLRKTDLCHRISVSKMAMDLFHCRYGFLPKAY